MKRRLSLRSAIAGLAMAAILLLSGINKAQAQEEKEFNFSASLNSDQFFGFYPTFAGSYGFSDKASFTFYGILWSGGTGGGWGNWTEFGIGANFTVSEGININPQIGVLGGNLLSSGADGPAVFGDGIVPNLTINLNKAKTEGQLYFGYYAPLRDETFANGTTLSFIHYWVNYGFKANSFLSLGAHYEHLINSGGSNVAESTDVYQWLGPYIQFADPKGGPFARFSFGTDLVEGNDSFFKLTTGFSF
ncbi:hypothetical protein GYM62_13625 [Algoriphagus sp. NBT04N3]|uniref:DUF6733 family protein n=1 Tax=Algoriphagus sp. NBT04N3 TaxID=2705473 RepID=UPI001C627DD9|nr:DUF6733 family protein [Algoriphagus sp. NBT04N3]QYH39772.1 hypothetical protein GYM62_13625 [Algoriphagus sp. NBT04N3]